MLSTLVPIFVRMSIVELQYILDSREKTVERKRMRPERPSGIVELRQQLRKELKPHEQYNTGHEIPPVSAHLRAEVRCKSCQPEVQQKPVLHLLLACPLRRFPAITGMPVPTSSQPPTSIPKRSLSSSLICTDETPTWESWSYGRRCGNEDIHEPWKVYGG